MRWRPAAWNLVTLWACAALVGLRVRAWQLGGREALGWQDTTDYVTSSRAPLLSLELWAGLRTPAIPILFKITGGDGQNAMALQAIVAALCWAALAAAVAAALPEGWRRWAAAALVVGVSLTSRTTMFDQSLLSESLALAFLALTTAAAITLARQVTPWRAAGLVVAAAMWVAVRDTPAVALVAGAAVLGVVLLVARPHPPGRVQVLGTTMTGLVLVAGLTMLAADHGGRDRLPLEHVFAVRILPYSDRLDWFADHGMPQADEIEALGPAAPVIPGGPLLRSVPDPVTDPDFAPWHDWIRSRGRGTYLRWLATHPGYVLTEPQKDPERSYNNAEGDLTFYRAPDFRHVPLIGILSIPTAWMVPIGLLLAAAALWFGRYRSPLTLAGTAVPHGLMAWHSDGMEVARHLVVPGMQLRLAVVLLAAALLDRERSQGLPATGAMGTVTENTLAPIEHVDNVDDDDQNSGSRRQVLDTSEA